MTEIFSENEVSLAAEMLKNGELVAFSTETVYGLGAPLFSPESIQEIFRVKGRPQDNPLIAHIADLASAEEIATDLPHAFFQLAKAFFPGPLTLVVKRAPSVPSIVSAGLPTIAIRMPKNALARKLIFAVGQPLVAPSANISGTPSSTSAQHVLSDFSGKIAGIIDGGSCDYGIESTVLDLVSFSSPTLLRPGVVTKEELEGVLGEEVLIYSEGPKASPGMKYRHYAPKAKVVLLHDQSSLKEEESSYILSTSPLSVPHFPLESASLYAHLRDADEKGYSRVVILIDKELDRALANRLEKIVDENHCHQPIRKC